MENGHDIQREIFRLRRAALLADTRDLPERAGELKAFIVEGDVRDRMVIKGMRRRLYDGDIPPEEFEQRLLAAMRVHMDMEKEATVEAAEELADIMGVAV